MIAVCVGSTLGSNQNNVQRITQFLLFSVVQDFYLNFLLILYHLSPSRPKYLQGNCLVLLNPSQQVCIVYGECWARDKYLDTSVSPKISPYFFHLCIDAKNKTGSQDTNHFIRKILLCLFDLKLMHILHYYLEIF